MGLLRQRDGATCVRLGVTGGAVPAAGLRAAAEAAERFGTGAVHLTTRQTIEIPGVAEADLGEALDGLVAAGWSTAAGGPRVRAVVACPGAAWCRFGLVDGQALAERVAAHARSRGDLPHKFKIAIAGCPNGCAKPVENDFGL
ncbi:MAG: coenzyme F420 hydrogenase, partial [Planctomycetota bacterium]